MSWGLLNQNLPTLESAGAGYPIDGGQTYTGVNIFTGTTGIGASLFYYNSGDNGGNMFAAAKNSDKIMLAESPIGKLFFSDDFGDTWTERTSFTYNGANLHISSIQYDAALDFWYIAVYNDPTRVLITYRSDDDGVTWAVYNDFAAHTYSQGQTLANDGSIILGSRPLTFRHYASPSDSNVYTAFADDASMSNPLAAWKTLSGYYIGIGDNGLYSWAADYTLTPTDYNTVSAGATYRYWIAGGEGSDSVAYITSKGTQDVNVNVLTYGDPVSTLPTATYDFGIDIFAASLHLQDSGWLITATQQADRGNLLFTRSSGTTFGDFHASYNTIELTDTHNGDLNDGHIQLSYTGGSRWIVGYVDSLGYVRLDTFEYGGLGNHPDAASSGLRRAIQGQQPEIFMQFDDAIGVTTVLDKGSAQYENTIIGTPTFETAALAPDSGTSVLFTSATDQCISVTEAVTPVNHAHVFLLSHDGTAAVRVLAASQIEDPTYDSYTIELSADHKLSYSAYIGGVRTTTVTTTAIATDTATLVACQVSDDGTVKFYVDTARDGVATGLGIPTPRLGHYSIGGLLDTADRDSNIKGADGVTIDYYALIPNSSFSYYILATEGGVAYVPPEVDAGGISAEGAQFHVTFEEGALTGPLISTRLPGLRYYDYTNRVPNSFNRVSTTQATSRFTTGKYGSYGVTIPARLPGDPWWPVDCPYWPLAKAGNIYPEPLEEVEFGTDPFTFACWFKPTADHGLAMFGNNGAYKIGDRYRNYSGIACVVVKDPNNANQTWVAMAISAPKGSDPEVSGTSSWVYWRGLPGIAVDTWSHFAFVRETDGSFHAYIDGVKSGPVEIIAGVDPTGLHIGPGGTAFLVGNYVHSGWYGKNIHRSGGGMVVDDVLLVTGRALYTETFTPPTAAYTFI